MNDILKSFESVFPGCKVHGDIESALKDPYPYIKKWQRARIRPNVTAYMAEESREPFKWCHYDGMPRKINPSVCFWHKAERDMECVRRRCF